MSGIPVYVESRETVAGFYHPPTGAVTGTGVLIVGPHGWDDQGSYRPRRDWAVHLAAAGFGALRFDFPGSGDSDGYPHDPDRLGAWTAAVTDAVGWLRDTAAATRIAVIGIGTGCLVTLDAGVTVDDLVLWGTPASGRAAVRELKAFGRLESTQTGEDPADAPEGEIRAGGHVLSAEAAAALSALDPVALIAAHPPARALLLGRDGVETDAKIVAALRAGGATAETDPGRGWGGATAPADHARSPVAVFERVEAWLRAAAPPATGRTPVLPEATALFTVDGAAVRETPLQFPGGAGRLYGVLCEPADAAPTGTALLLNAGAIRHIGPNRMWTETARRWAALGIATLRMDLEGIGEADGDGEPYIDAEALHVASLPPQVVTAMDVLAARGLPTRFLLGGMCSGAYWAFQAALKDDRVCGIVALNQRLFFFDPDAEPNRELQRFLRILTPQGFRNMLIGERRFLRLLRLLRWLAASPARIAARRRNPAPPGDPLNDALDHLIKRGTRLDLAFSHEEPLEEALRASDRIVDLADHGVRLHELPYISHTLKPVAAQKAAAAVLDAVAVQTFGCREREPV